VTASGYTAPAVFEAGGNPYGLCFATGPKGDTPSDATLLHGRYLGKRLAELAQKLRA